MYHYLDKKDRPLKYIRDHYIEKSDNLQQKGRYKSGGQVSTKLEMIAITLN